MLRSQDCIILLKLLANPGREWTQRQLAIELCISLGEVNSGIKRLIKSNLLRKKFDQDSVFKEEAEKVDSVSKSKTLVSYKTFISDVQEISHKIDKERFQYVPIISSSKEFLIYGIKYFFPGKLGEFARGIPTAYGAPLYSDKIVLGNDPIPVWPYALGQIRGVALEPIHSSVPNSLHDFADEEFYEFLVLIDAIRVGRARERNMAVKMLEGKLNHGSKTPN